MLADLYRLDKDQLNRISKYKDEIEDKKGGESARAKLSDRSMVLQV